MKNDENSVKCDILWDYKQIVMLWVWMKKTTNFNKPSYQHRKKLIKDPTAMDKKRTHFYRSQCANCTPLIHIINLLLFIAVQCISGKPNFIQSKFYSFFYIKERTECFLLLLIWMNYSTKKKINTSALRSVFSKSS